MPTVSALVETEQFLHAVKKAACLQRLPEVVQAGFRGIWRPVDWNPGCCKRVSRREADLTQTERGELEGLIANGLQHIKASETELCERYRQLQEAPAEDREGFLNSLWELNRRASTLERLIGCLDPN